MAISVPGASDQFTQDRGLLEQVYRFDTSKIRPCDVIEIAALSEGGKLTVDELRPLYHAAIETRLAEVTAAQVTRGGRR